MRFLSSLLIALAMFFSPLAMASASGMALAHGTDATMTGMDDGHCPGASDTGGGDHESGMQMNCTGVCSAIAAAQPAVTAPIFPVAPAVEVNRPRMLTGIAPESETPPPRFS